MTNSSRDLEVSGKPDAVFSCQSESSLNTFSERDRSNEPGNRVESSVHSVFKFADPANVGKSLLDTHKRFGSRSMFYTAKFHGRVADQHKSHLLQVVSPKPSRTKRSSLKTSSPDRNLWTDPYQRHERFMRNSHQNPIAEDMDEFGKVGAEMSYLQPQMHSDYDSAESIAGSDLEGGEL